MAQKKALEPINQDHLEKPAKTNCPRHLLQSSGPIWGSLHPHQVRQWARSAVIDDHYEGDFFLLLLLTQIKRSEFRKAKREQIPSTTYNLLVLVFYFCVINYHKFSSLKWYPFTSSQFGSWEIQGWYDRVLYSRAERWNEGVSQVQFLAGGSGEESASKFIQVVVEFSCLQLQNWSSISLLAVSQGLRSAPRGCLHSLLCGCLPSPQPASGPFTPPIPLGICVSPSSLPLISRPNLTSLI